MSLRNPNLLTLQPIQPRTVEVETVVKTRKRSGYLDQAVTPAAVAALVGPHPAVVHDPVVEVLVQAVPLDLMLCPQQHHWSRATAQNPRSPLTVTRLEPTMTTSGPAESVLITYQSDLQIQA